MFGILRSAFRFRYVLAPLDRTDAVSGDGHLKFLRERLRLALRRLVAPRLGVMPRGGEPIRRKPANFVEALEAPIPELRKRIPEGAH